MKKILFSLSLAIVILSASSPALAHSEATPHGVIISTGSEKDLYYKIGQGLLREQWVAQVTLLNLADIVLLNFS